MAAIRRRRLWAFTRGLLVFLFGWFLGNYWVDGVPLHSHFVSAQDTLKCIGPFFWKLRLTWAERDRGGRWMVKRHRRDRDEGGF
ncbi:hypothetical protein B0T25DRAFT_555960 [Lasiosphaeria hispida]|uniref:Uncharacterized protein n=1 Tax=Lasiosphaeria hispida TaxID=260671 RepID=A0AAJ0M9M8_9PEZI|nr:hypothetical protein B0T25DRAFT_555960 [Lasiosphaeria hispida]